MCKLKCIYQNTCPKHEYSYRDSVIKSNKRIGAKRLYLYLCCIKKNTGLDFLDIKGKETHLAAAIGMNQSEFCEYLYQLETYRISGDFAITLTRGIVKVEEHEMLAFSQKKTGCRKLIQQPEST